MLMLCQQHPPIVYTKLRQVATMSDESSIDVDSGSISFEQAVGQLGEAVHALEAGGLPLAEATRLFEKGMKLARLCNEMLVSAELQITRIQAAYGEQMRMLEQDETAMPEEESC